MRGGNLKIFMCPTKSLNQIEKSNIHINRSTLTIALKYVDTELI